MLNEITNNSNVKRNEFENSINKIKNGSLIYSYHETLASVYPVYFNQNYAQLKVLESQK